MVFFKDLSRYFRYATYSAVSELKAQVAGSYLGWLWWILDPLCLMLVYSFVVIVVFKANIENFPLFVFIGLTAWNFFGATAESSIGIINSYSAVTKKTYIPKCILVLMTEFVNLIKMFIGIVICLVAILILRIPITINILSMIPILIVYFIFTFGVGVVFAHMGAFISDLSHVISIIMRFLFYLSAVFYSLENLPVGLLSVYNMICPTGFIIVQFRNVMMNGIEANYTRLLYWLIIALLLTVLGLIVMYRKEKDYMKVG
ncbi:MAG: ABC transporter permease [Clostridiales bacterium]|nr:ABC transporter permease [Clostridiales bacterium]